MKKFHLRIYDNFHYGDVNDFYKHGEFDTYEEALAEAKLIVDEFLRYNWKKGITPNELIVHFSFFGEDPIIVPEREGQERFSARTYVDSRAAEICSLLEVK